MTHLTSTRCLAIVAVLALVLASCAESNPGAATSEGITTTAALTTTAPVDKSTHSTPTTRDGTWSGRMSSTGSDLDETRWGYEQNCWGGGNQEQQCYTDRTDNTFLSDGVLHIRALEEQFTGIDGSEDWENADSARHDDTAVHVRAHPNQRQG